LLTELRRRNVFRAAAAYVAVAWLVVQVAETTFPAFGLSDDALRTLIVVLAVGFIPAVALSWAFELTPEGFKRDRDVAPDSELSLRTRRMLDQGIVIVLALGLAYFAFDKFVLDPARDEVKIEQAEQRGRTEALVESYGDQSIAVLPFTNMSADPEQEYFGDGMAEEVLNLLARIPELRVISRSSAFTYKGQNRKLTEIAEELNVVHILEGSVRRAGNQIRVTAQLIEARSDTHLWSATWDRELADIFAIQDEIAAEVVANLKIKLLGDVPTARRADPQAYALYLQGRFLIETNDPANLAPALDAMRSAIEIDPDYATAWTGLAWVYYRYYSRQRMAPIPGAPVTHEEARRLRAEAIERALALDPDDPVALSYEAWWRWRVEGVDFPEAARLYEQALASAPGNVDVLAGAGTFAYALGQTDVGTRLIEAALIRDPLCNWCQWTLVQVYSNEGRLDEAQALLDAMRARGVNVSWDVDFGYHLARGDFEHARRILEEQPSARADVMVGHAQILVAEGRTDEAREIAETLAATAADSAALDVAGLYGMLGDFDRALEWIEKEIDANGCRRLKINFGDIQRKVEPFQDDPRWLDVARRCEVSPGHIAQIGFAPVVPE
jgi:TolB-like protein